MRLPPVLPEAIATITNFESVSNNKGYSATLFVTLTETDTDALSAVFADVQQAFIKHRKDAQLTLDISFDKSPSKKKVGEIKAMLEGMGFVVMLPDKVDTSAPVVEAEDNAQPE